MSTRRRPPHPRLKSRATAPDSDVLSLSLPRLNAFTRAHASLHRVDLIDGWTCWLGIDEQDGVAVVAGALVECPQPIPIGGLKTTALRGIRITAELGQWHQVGAELLGLVDEKTRVRWERQPLWRVESRKSGRPGRPARESLEWARIADAYVRACAENPRAPIALVAKALSISERRASELVHGARAHGMLSPAPPGRSGGALTEQAKAQLEGASSATAPPRPRRTTRKGG